MLQFIVLYYNFQLLSFPFCMPHLQSIFLVYNQKVLIPTLRLGLITEILKLFI